MFLGFDADPSLNIVARIRGPNVSFSCLIDCLVTLDSEGCV